MMIDLITLGFGILTSITTYSLLELIRMKKEIEESKKVMEEQEKNFRIEINNIKSMVN